MNPEKIIDRVDVEKIIDRVDVNAIVGRVDMQVIMGQVDIAPMARTSSRRSTSGDVRQSTGSITGDGGGWATAMRIDGFVDRVTDRILFRKKERNLVVPGYDPMAAEENQVGPATQIDPMRNKTAGRTPGQAADASRVAADGIDWGIVVSDLRRHPARPHAPRVLHRQRQVRRAPAPRPASRTCPSG